MEYGWLDYTPTNHYGKNPRSQENYPKKVRRTLLMSNEVMQKILDWVRK